ADEPGNPYTAQQLATFEAAVAALAAHGIHPPLLHAANSAGAIAHPAARYGMVRCGIALYGLDPDPALAGQVELRPAMAVKARDEVVRVGGQGDARVTAGDWATRLDTIAYEIVCGIGPRVPRVYVS